MRILFASVSAHGHLLPQVPLVHAAIEAGHAVAVMVSEELRTLVETQLPSSTTFLPAGPMPMVLASVAAERTAGDLMHPTVEGIGETFGGVQLDYAIDDAVLAARTWAPDVIVSDMYNTLGPYLSAVLTVPWHEFVMTVDIPEQWLRAITAAAEKRFDTAGLRIPEPTSIIDLWPNALRDKPVTTANRWPMQATAHRSADPAASSRAATREKHVLVTLGTTFPDTAALSTIADSLAEGGMHVVVTRAMMLGEDLPDSAVPGDTTTVSWVPFRPLAELLVGAVAVVTAGGAGTVLAALSQGIPLVLWPQGADQPAIAESVVRAGAGVSVTDSSRVAAAVHELLAGDDHRVAAQRLAAQISSAMGPREIVDRITMVNG